MRLILITLYFLLQANLAFSQEKTSFWKFRLDRTMQSSLKSVIKTNDVLIVPKYANTLTGSNKKLELNLAGDDYIAKPKKNISYDIDYYKIGKKYNLFFGFSKNSINSDLKVSNTGYALSEAWDIDRKTKPYIFGVGSGSFEISYQDISIGVPFYKKLGFLIIPKLINRSYKHSILKKRFDNIWSGKSGIVYSTSEKTIDIFSGDGYGLSNLEAKSSMNYIGISIEKSLPKKFNILLNYYTVFQSKGSFQDFVFDSKNVKVSYKLPENPTTTITEQVLDGSDLSLGSGELLVSGKSATLGFSYRYNDNLELYITDYREYFKYSYKKNFGLSFVRAATDRNKSQISKSRTFVTPSENTIQKFIIDRNFKNEAIEIKNYRFGVSYKI